MTTQNITVIGLGSMGYGAACSLVGQGFTTYGVDIVDSTLDKFAQAGGIPAKSVSVAVADSDIVFLYVVNAEQVKSVLFGDGASTNQGCVHSAKQGTIFVLCVTMPPNETIAIAQQIEQAGMQVLDAPVSGGAAKAMSGEITIMGSGTPDVFKAVQPALDAISAKVFRLGDEVGVGSKIKMINQLLAGVHIAAMGEAMALAHKIDLDLATVYDVITQSAGNSWMFENRGVYVRDGDYAPRSAVDIFVKDLGIVSSESEQADFTPELTQTAWQLFRQASEAGMGRHDDAAVAKWIARKNGCPLTGDEET